MSKFFLVGGAVRDKLLGLPVKDLDYAVESTSFGSMCEAIIARGGRVFLKNPEFFTVRANVPGFGVADYVLCRKESNYTDGRHPDRVEMGTLEDDLARRDFTINAMAIGEDGFLVDPFNGKEDLQNKLIRTVGKAEERFNEDYLRILRALRFQITKNFALHEDIVTFIKSFDMDKLKSVSVERVREELGKMFSANSEWSLDTFLAFPHLIHIFNVFPELWLKPTLEKKD